MRPPWRKRFSLGRESLGGRSFRFTGKDGARRTKDFLYLRRNRFDGIARFRTRRFPYPTRRNPGCVAGETGHDECGRHVYFFTPGRRARDEIGLPRSLRADAVAGTSRDGGSMAMPSMPAIHGDLDARSPRRGQRTTRQTRVSCRILCPLFIRHSGRWVPSRVCLLPRGPGRRPPPRTRPSSASPDPKPSLTLTSSLQADGPLPGG